MVDCEKKISLIEDHHEAYYLWKKEGLRDKTLVHLDAHIDFGFHDVKPPKQIFKEARTKDGLKRELEKMLLFKKFQFSEEKQTNIGNYIYPAMRDGIVNKFYWVIPGKRKEFKSSVKDLRNMIKGFMRMDPYKNKIFRIAGSSIEAIIYNRNFIIVTLEDLPTIGDEVLLDIDVDYLTTSVLKVAASTDEIAKRKPWIYPPDLVHILKDRIKKPVFATICYSVNGGFTPMKYKFLGDEICSRLKEESSPEVDEIFAERQKANNLSDWRKLKRRVESCGRFEDQFKKKFLADIFFNIFLLSIKKEFYDRAVRLNPSYSARDNNYGPLYLMKRKPKKAEAEFKRILAVDGNSAFARAGLGDVYLRRREFPKAHREFTKAVELKGNFSEALFGLGIAKFHLKDYDEAGRSFSKYEERERPNADTRFYLARIYEMRKDFDAALEGYKNALQLGRNDAGLILRMSKILKKRRDEKTLKFLLEWHKKAKRSLHHPGRLKKKNRRFLRATKRFKKQIERVNGILKELMRSRSPAEGLK